MPEFAYRARNATGGLIEGVLDAPSQAAAADRLLAGGASPIEIRPHQESPLAPILRKLRGDGIDDDEVMLFSRQIHTLMKAGVPIMRALTGLMESSENPQMKRVLADVRDSLDSGKDMGSALGRHPKVFDPFYLSMVRVGEMTGRLDEIYLRLFHHLEFEQFMRNQVKAALRYPTFVVIAMAVAIAIINVWVIPSFARVFKGFNAELPLMTRLLLGFSEFTVTYWPVFVVGLVAAVFAFRSWTGQPRGRLQWDRIKLRIPVAGKIVRKATLARFARSFALAARSGVPIIQTMSVVALTVDNAYIASKVEGMRDAIERGESVLRSAIAARVFTPVVLQMIAVGEESGSIDEMMEEVAEMYQREVEYELKTLGAQIEPILIVFLGILVLILALGVFLPIWDLGSVAIKRN